MIGTQLNAEDSQLVIELARQLTGTKVTSKQHGVIIQNVASRISMLGLKNLEAYLEYVDKNDNEIGFLLGAVPARLVNISVSLLKKILYLKILFLPVFSGP